MDFIGRETEMTFLEDQFESVEHPFVIVKGRRRVGKSRLISEFVRDKNALIYQANRESSQEILRSFCSKISEYVGTDIGDQKTWESAFGLLVRLSGTGRRIVVLDEFSYICQSDREFVKTFQGIWDSILSKENIMLIISGSYMSMMDGLTTYGNPLYGRNTGDLLVRPISFRTCLSGREYKKAVELYAFTGGVPHYMQLIRDDRSAIDNIIMLTMSVGSPLTEEIPYLMIDEFRDTASFNTYLRTIATGNRKMESICSRLEVGSKDVSPYLRKLIAVGMLERRTPITEKSPEKSRNGMYVISDRFISAWFRFVFPFINEITAGNNDAAVSKLKKSYISEHTSFVFEDICREELREYLRNEGISASYGSYWDSHHEIDVAAKTENNVLYLGECKYLSELVGLEALHQLEATVSDVR